MKVRSGFPNPVIFSQRFRKNILTSPHHHVYNQQFPQVDFAQELPIFYAWGTDRPPNAFFIVPWSRSLH